MLHAMIMAGGGGTRFWPRSRQKRPKQFLTLTGERTLIQEARDRIEAQVRPEHTWVITAKMHCEEVGRQLAGVPAGNIVGEPCGRDTAACIGLGAALIARHDPAAAMLVMSADHLIEPAQEFRRAVHVAAGLADEHPKALITFGITPTYPATGYGYIHRGAKIADRQGVSTFRVQRFREKPNSEQAEQLLATGEYFWNAGIFAWKTSAILQALKDHQPKLHAALRQIADAWTTPQRDAVFQREYEALEKISIDYAVLEKAKEVLVVEAPFRWDDVGSWLALERLHPQDADGNTIQGLHCGINTKSCVVVADAGTLIGTVGVANLLIIQDGDAILVADRREEGNIKHLVELLKKNGLENYL